MINLCSGLKQPSGSLTQTEMDSSTGMSSNRWVHKTCIIVIVVIIITIIIIIIIIIIVIIIIITIITIITYNTEFLNVTVKFTWLCAKSWDLYAQSKNNMHFNHFYSFGCMFLTLHCSEVKWVYCTQRRHRHQGGITMWKVKIIISKYLQLPRSCPHSLYFSPSQCLTAFLGSSWAPLQHNHTVIAYNANDVHVLSFDNFVKFSQFTLHWSKAVRMQVLFSKKHSSEIHICRRFERPLWISVLPEIKICIAKPCSSDILIWETK